MKCKNNFYVLKHFPYDKNLSSVSFILGTKTKLNSIKLKLIVKVNSKVNSILANLKTSTKKPLLNSTPKKFE